MKKLIFSISVLIMVISCQVNEIIPDYMCDDNSIYSSIEQVNVTKTSMDENNNVLWSENDQLVAFMKTTLGIKYQIKEQYVGTTTGGFSKVQDAGSGDDLESGQEIDHNVVLYPYSTAVWCMKNDNYSPTKSYKLNVVLPETQTYAENSFANGAFPMVAVSSTNQLTFKNICGGLKLQFKGVDKIKSIKLEGLGNEAISGKSSVVAYTDGSAPTITMAATASKSVILDCGDGVQLSESTPTTFIIAVPPVTFSSGMKITVTDTDGFSKTLTNTSSNTIKRSSLLNFPVITYKQNGVFEIPEGAQTSYETPAEGGIVEIPIVTNQDYEVVIPESAQDWIGVAETKAMREEVITLNILENTTAEARSAEVLIASLEGTPLQVITISQEAGDVSFPTCIDLSALGTANSYIVSTDGAYQFTPTKGNSSESVGTIAAVEVLWESFGTDVTPNVGDLVKKAKYNNGVITFETPSAYKEGNAVIAAKDASGKILWSWHIWLTDQPDGQVYYNNAGIMMDRNLGATSATPGDVGALGLLYQWGRKDPFLGSSSVSSKTVAKSTLTWPSAVTSNSSNGTITYATANPTTFIGYNSSNYDWYYTGSTSTDNTRWTTSDKTKSIYDPCPSGWCVPDGGDNGVWSKALGSGSSFSSYLYDSTNEGMNFSEKFGSASIIWYPASGYRKYNDGSFYNVGKIGHFWSASPNDSYAFGLYFYDGGFVNPSADYNRAFGQSVRCIAESSINTTPSEPVYDDLSETGTANSYIVSKSGAYQFTPTKGNSSESVGAIASAEVLWETFGTDVTPNVGDLVKNVKYEEGVVKFETPSTYKEGNAVIAAKDASGKILWSWHIWLTDQPEGQVYYNNAGIMMDRNLGATSATPGDVGALGLLYQWGRKDPFLGSSSISSNTVAKSTLTWPSAVVSDSSNGTIAYATANPTTFIGYNSSNYDWYYTGSFSTDDTRWTTSESSKSIYDPCPSGWRVPDGGDNGVWSKALSGSTLSGYPYDSTNEGMNFSGKFGGASIIWYPASGYRRYDVGSLGNVGFHGHCWSASPGSSPACSLYFNYGGYVSPSSGNYRAYGQSVRCLQESK